METKGSGSNSPPARRWGEGLIIHAAKPRRDFTIIPNRVLRDDALSYRARGLLAYLLSQPPGWLVSSSRLALQTGEGRDAVRRALRELMNVGYLNLDRQQDKRGLWASHYTVTDTPWYFDLENEKRSAHE